MDFNFKSLERLQFHYHFLTEKMSSSDFFLVGGCIRDLLLGLTNQPEDIDFTMAGDPKELYNSINKEHLSHFITEKFGTITLIPQKQNESHNLKYELTPLRAETGYSDTRHPDEIFRSNDLLLDYQRRDFSINAIYYLTTTLKTPQYETNKTISTEYIIKHLSKEGFIYLTNQETLIIQDEKLISQTFPEGKKDQDYLYYLLDIQKEGYHYGDSIKEYTPYTNLNIIIDPAHGLQDMVHKKLQTVGNPDKRFQEDALRLLRALRFVNIINQELTDQSKKQPSNPTNKMQLFDFEPDTRRSIKKNHNLLKNIAKERIKEELIKSFTKGNPFSLIGLIDETEMLPIIFPALALTKHVDQPIRYHPFDIYTHILLTLYYLQQINDNYLVRFAMLYHDVGKVGQYAEYKKDLSRDAIRELLASPLNHRHSSAELAKEDFNNLGFSHKEIEEIMWYIKEHHTPGEILQANPENREKKLRKMLSENGFERVSNLLDINIADRLGMYNPLQNASDLSDSRYLKEILNKINNEEGQFKAKDLAINGDDIMKEFNLQPGKQIGELLQLALDWVLGDVKNRNTKKQIFANIKNHLKNLKEKS